MAPTGEAAQDEQVGEGTSAKLEPPDQEPFRVAIEDLAWEVHQLRNELKALDKDLAIFSWPPDRRGELRERWEEQAATILTLLGKRSALLQETEFPEEAGDRIDELELKLLSKDLPIREEKALLEEIATLRPGSEVATPEFSVLEPGRREELEEICRRLAKHRDMKAVVEEEFASWLSSRHELAARLRSVVERRNGINEQIREKAAERLRLRDDFRAQRRAYEERDAKARASRAEEVRWEREGRKREVEKDRLQKELSRLDRQSNLDEISLAKQAIRFCQSMLPKEEVDEEGPRVLEHELKQGEVVLMDKSYREVEYHLEPKRRGKPSKTKGRKEDQHSKPLRLEAKTMKLFASMQLSAPVSCSEIPGLLSQLEEKLRSYERASQQWAQEGARLQRKLEILAAGGDLEEDEGEPPKEATGEAEEQREDADGDEAGEEGGEEEEGARGEEEERGEEGGTADDGLDERQDQTWTDRD